MTTTHPVPGAVSPTLTKTAAFHPFANVLVRIYATCSYEVCRVENGRKLTIGLRLPQGR